MIIIIIIIIRTTTTIITAYFMWAKERFLICYSYVSNNSSCVLQVAVIKLMSIS